MLICKIETVLDVLRFILEWLAVCNFTYLLLIVLKC